MTINNYKFGEMIINDTKYTTDLILFCDHVADNWWRKSGHDLLIDDMQTIIDRNPDKLFIGTGKFGFMKVSQKTIVLLNNSGVTDLFIGNTSNAVKAYNKENITNKIGAFHLSC